MEAPLSAASKGLSWAVKKTGIKKAWNRRDNRKRYKKIDKLDQELNDLEEIARESFKQEEAGLMKQLKALSETGEVEIQDLKSIRKYIKTMETKTENGENDQYISSKDYSEDALKLNQKIQSVNNSLTERDRKIEEMTRDRIKRLQDEIKVINEAEAEAEAEAEGAVNDNSSENGSIEMVEVL